MAGRFGFASRFRDFGGPVMTGIEDVLVRPFRHQMSLVSFESPDAQPLAAAPAVAELAPNVAPVLDLVTTADPQSFGAAPAGVEPAPNIAPTPEFAAPPEAVSLTPSSPNAAAFAAGNVVVYRVGTGAAALNGNATAVFLDEYTPAGALVQTIALPTADSGSNQMLTAAGSSTAEGLLTRSADGRYLVLTGYDAAVGTLTPNTTSSATIQRVIGRVDGNGTVDTSTTLGTAFNSGNVRGATSLDGSSFWAVGSVTGVVNAAFGATTSTLISNTFTNLRSIDIANGQLYTSSGSGALRLGTVGTGTPTTSGQTITSLPSFPTSTLSPYQFYFADLTAAVAGVDTLYVTDDRSVATGGGLLKFSLVSGSWISNGTASGSLVSGLRGLTGSTSGTAVSFFATDAATTAHIVTLTDTGGYNAAFSTTTFATIATASVNTTFRGIAFAPTAAGSSPGTLAINDVSQNEGNSGATDFAFTVTRSGGSAGAVAATWTLNHGTTDAGDFTSFPQTGTVSFADGQTTATVHVAVNGDVTYEANETFTVDLTAPTGGVTLGDAQGLGTIVNDDAAPVAQLSINDVTQAEGNSGTTNFVFTVTRGGDTTTAASATWTVNNGTTDAADFAGALTGTVAFAAGETSQTITVGINGDTVMEANETFTVDLTNASANTVFTDASGLGTITNDDLPPVANVFVNEINYDPPSTDTNEYIEIAGLAGTDLTGWKIVLYNGNGGVPYAASGGTTAGIPLSGTLTDQSNGFGFLKVLAPGTQNGAPDGFALVDNYGRVIQFLSYEGSFVAVGGPANGLTSTDIGVSQTNDALTLQLTGTGSSYGDFTWTSQANTEGALNVGQSFRSGTDQGQISISDARVVEGNSGTADLTFVVHRAGGFASAASVDWTLALNAPGPGSADAADLTLGGTQSGTVSFGANEYSKTITIQVNGDTAPEFNETLQVLLSNATGNAAIADGAATGTIVNDDPLALAIHDIQGASHTSAYVGQSVITTGIVTLLTTTGFYLQDPNPDGDRATSEGIFVFTGTAPTVAVGDALSVAAMVNEYAPATDPLSLTTTELEAPTITVLSSGNALPAAVLIGINGLLPPSEVIDDDGLTVFDPVHDAIDFYESLEGMRVTIDAPQAVERTTSFGETYVVASNGVGATGITPDGGIVISAGDYNPEKIMIDSLNTTTAQFIVGDKLTDVTGVLGYSFDTYKVLYNVEAAIVTPSTLARETTALVGDATHLSVATYNVENLDPSDNKYSVLADDIIYHLGAPDIIALQEVQDDNGPGSGVLSADQNLTNLVNALNALDTTANYVFASIAPTTENTSGGEPGGNIRNAFLYDTNRVSLLAGSLALIEDPAFNNSRKPLVGTFVFNSQELTLVNVHTYSRGGSEPDFGNHQPASISGDSRRTAMADAVVNYLNAHLATDPQHQYGVLGDFNGFYFEQAFQHLTDNVTGGLVNVSTALLPQNERYSYQFAGNLQEIDYLLTTPGLLTGAQYDAVHINAEFNPATRASDHDPQVALLNFATPGAANDSATTLETVTATGNVLTNDAGTAISVVSINGQSADVGQQITLASGALLTINANGTYSYNANGAFKLVDAASGAANTSATDSFSYAINGGSSATVTVTVNGVDQPGDTFLGSAGDDTITGSANFETFDLRQGGNDFVSGLGDDDTFYFGAAFGAGDQIDGGAGTDRVVLQGDYSGGTVLGANAVAGIERFELLAGNNAAYGAGGTNSYSYDLSLAASVLAAGQVLTIDGSGLRVGEDLSFNGGDPGRAGSVVVIGGAGHDVITGTSSNDTLDGGAGINVLNGGAGDDRLILSAVSNQTDFDGGSGYDTLVVTGQAQPNQITGFEAIEFQNGATLYLSGQQFANGFAADSVLSGSGSLVVTLADGDIFAAGQISVAAGSNIASATIVGTGTGDVVKGFGAIRNIINGFDGDDLLRGGQLSDTIDGGAGNDKIEGGLGADILTGGAGADQFRFQTAAASGLGANADHITDFMAGTDFLAFRLLDADPVAPGQQHLNYVGSSAFVADGSAQIHWLVSGADIIVEADLNGDGFADMQIFLDNAGTQVLTSNDFLL